MIARRRIHPRKHSYSFQTFHWLLALEASWMICCDSVAYRSAIWTRAEFFKRFRSCPRRPGELILSSMPSRRFR